jgi:hypothetical protein
MKDFFDSTFPNFDVFKDFYELFSRRNITQIII